MIETGKSPSEPTTMGGRVESTAPFVVESGTTGVQGEGRGVHLESSPPSASLVVGRDGRSLQEGVDSIGSRPPPPCEVGRYAPPWGGVTGVPDWGALKRKALSEGYPQRWSPPGPTTDPVPFPQVGEDPASDWVWNSGIRSDWGTGRGACTSGAFGTKQITRTWRVLGPTLCTVSGIVYPADRGCLALIRWPDTPTGQGGTVEMFLQSSLEERVVAAIVLGSGLEPLSPAGRVCGCDGEAGGIFDPGRDVREQYDPFGYPGRASGQYDLDEILRGRDSIESRPLRPPFDDLNGDGVAGAARKKGSTVRAAGQVRLGSQPGRFYLPYGIPVLGAGPDGYDPLPAPVGGRVVVGQTVVAIGTVLPNFFAYRLPQLDAYQTLPYTPRPMRGEGRETERYFRVRQPAAPTYQDGTPLPLRFDRAGDYPNSPQADWGRQLARYRHCFVVGEPGRFSVGSVFLLHFRTEAAFERFVLEGRLDPEDLFGAVPNLPLDRTENLTNQGTDADQPPRGPAPKWGYAGEAYHLGRSHLVFPGPAPAPTLTSSVEVNIPPTPQVQWVSGVAYLCAVDSNGVGQLSLDRLTVKASGAFVGGVWGDSDELLLNRTDPPAQLNVPCPVVISVSGFSQDVEGGRPNLRIPPTLTDFTGSDLQPRVGRIEIPLSFCGGNPAPYGATNPPQETDLIEIGPIDPILLLGDVRHPSFTEEARLQGEVRMLGLRTTFPINPTHTPSVPILLHTGRADELGEVWFGNHLTPTGEVVAGLERPEKDTSERFLDEVYRYEGFAPARTLYGAKGEAALLGPGLDWSGGFVPVPVRVGSNPTWEKASWVRGLHHLTPLPAGALQVGGFPYRDPRRGTPDRPFPAAGLLRYPTRSYRTVRPSKALDALPREQPDYTGLVGFRSYVRAFDVRGSTDRVRIRLDGVGLRDIQYRSDTDPLQVCVKVPGLTTWMHLGRRDGQGPSKQDPLRDLAGCQRSAREGVDSSGLTFCEVEVYLGPQARTALGYGAEYPILFRVRMDENAAPYDQTHPLIRDVWGRPDPLAPLSETRGICGVRVSPAE